MASRRGPGPAVGGQNMKRIFAIGSGSWGLPGCSTRKSQVMHRRCVRTVILRYLFVRGRLG